MFLLLMLEIADRVVMKRRFADRARDSDMATPRRAAADSRNFDCLHHTSGKHSRRRLLRRISAPRQNHRRESRDVRRGRRCGKSIPAAMLMATLQASLKTLATEPIALPELVSDMNKYACSNSQGGLRFTTAFLAEYDAARRTFLYINAGHNNPILRRANGSIERLDAGGLPLGILSEAKYESASVTLAPGDWLIIFTDGLVEAKMRAMMSTAKRSFSA